MKDHGPWSMAVCAVLESAVRGPRSTEVGNLRIFQSYNLPIFKFFNFFRQHRCLKFGNETKVT
jgi:hypothetical protein